MPGLTKLFADAKGTALGALRAAQGELPFAEKDKGYRKLLEDGTYRAWKTVVPDEPQAQRFLAEVHAMRGSSKIDRSDSAPSSADERLNP
jgi:hypothetical protein